MFIFNMKIHRWKGSNKRFDDTFKLKFLAGLVVICKFKMVKKFADDLSP